MYVFPVHVYIVNTLIANLVILFFLEYKNMDEYLGNKSTSYHFLITQFLHMQAYYVVFIIVLLDAPRQNGPSRNYRQQPVYYGQPYQMECPLEGSPPTNYIWKKYETIDMMIETNFSTDVHFEDGGRVWYVAVITDQHSGMYTCSAVNSKGEMVFIDRVDFYLDISGKQFKKL